MESPSKGLQGITAWERVSEKLHPEHTEFLSKTPIPPGSAGPSPLGTILGVGEGGDVKKGEEKAAGRCMSMHADPTSQLRRHTAGLHGKLQPAHKDNGYDTKHQEMGCG
jgi:hypothetical protein